MTLEEAWDNVVTAICKLVFKLIINTLAYIGLFSFAAVIALVPLLAVTIVCAVFGLVTEERFWMAFGLWEGLMAPLVFIVEVYYVYKKKDK